MENALPGFEEWVLTVHGYRSVGVTNITACAVAGQPKAVVPAPGILADVSSQRGGVSNLWACDPTGSVFEQTVLLANYRRTLDLRECRQWADLDTVSGLADTPELYDGVEIDKPLRASSLGP